MINYRIIVIVLIGFLFVGYINKPLEAKSFETSTEHNKSISIDLFVEPNEVKIVPQVPTKVSEITVKEYTAAAAESAKVAAEYVVEAVRIGNSGLDYAAEYQEMIRRDVTYIYVDVNKTNRIEEEVAKVERAERAVKRASEVAAKAVKAAKAAKIAKEAEVEASIAVEAEIAAKIALNEVEVASSNIFWIIGEAGADIAPVTVFEQEYVELPPVRIPPPPTPVEPAPEPIRIPPPPPPVEPVVEPAPEPIPPKAIRDSGNESIGKVNVGIVGESSVKIENHKHQVISNVEERKKLSEITTYVLFPKNLSKSSTKTDRYKRYAKVLEIIQEIDEVNGSLKNSLNEPNLDETNVFVLFADKNDQNKTVENVTVKNYNYALARNTLDEFRDKYNEDGLFDGNGPYLVTVGKNIWNDPKDYSFLYVNLSNYNKSAVDEIIGAYSERLDHDHNGLGEVKMFEMFHAELLSFVTNFHKDIKVFQTAVAGGLDDL